jgi:hypothetical protein
MNKTNQINQINPFRQPRVSRAAILRGVFASCPSVQAIEVLLCRNGFPAAC